MLKNGLQDFKCILFTACVVEVAQIIITDIELEYSTVLECDARFSRLFHTLWYRALFLVGFVSALRVSGGGGLTGLKVMAQERVWAGRASEMM